MKVDKGITYGVAAFTLWGFFPIYWKALHEAQAAEILAHRMAWSLVFVLLLLGWQQRWHWIRQAVRTPRILATSLATGSILALNWFVYIWAVNAGYIVETSLGYFINPLVNVLLGFLFLGERLRSGQAGAVAIALGGVLYLTLSYGALPWIALTLAFSFGIYGLLRKTAALNALEGLSLETGILFLPAVGYLVYLEWQGTAVFGHGGWQLNFLLLFSGVATALPLLLFAMGARRIRLTTMGILQYLAPSLQFLIGVFIYGENFGRDRMIGFSLIWIALLIYTLEAIFSARRARSTSSA
jgi:chloramphenicol-sensitive protein RarD